MGKQILINGQLQKGSFFNAEKRYYLTYSFLWKHCSNVEAKYTAFSLFDDWNCNSEELSQGPTFCLFDRTKIV